MPCDWALLGALWASKGCEIGALESAGWIRSRLEAAGRRLGAALGGLGPHLPGGLCAVPYRHPSPLYRPNPALFATRRRSRGLLKALGSRRFGLLRGALELDLTGVAAPMRAKTRSSHLWEEDLIVDVSRLVAMLLRHYDTHHTYCIYV